MTTHGLPTNESWRESPSIQEYKANIEGYFAEKSDEALTWQLGSILEVELIESGRMANDLSRNQNNVAKSLLLLLEGGLKSDEDRTFLETDRTRIGREACVAEFMKRIISRQPEVPRG